MENSNDKKIIKNSLHSKIQIGKESDNIKACNSLFSFICGNSFEFESIYDNKIGFTFSGFSKNYFRSIKDINYNLNYSYNNKNNCNKNNNNYNQSDYNKSNDFHCENSNLNYNNLEVNLLIEELISKRIHM